MVAGLYYNLQADYSTQLWKEFQKSIENTNAIQGISCVRYQSLILQCFYDKEGILVPADEEKAIFHTYHCPKDTTDDLDEFTFAARIPDVMLKRIDPSNPILVSYLETIDTSVETGILLPQTSEKKSKKMKKTDVGSPDIKVKP